MCLAVPGKILSIEGMAGVVDMNGVEVNVGLQLVPGAKVGDYVLMHAGFAIQSWMRLRVGHPHRICRLFLVIK